MMYGLQVEMEAEVMVVEADKAEVIVLLTMEGGGTDEWELSGGM